MANNQHGADQYTVSSDHIFEIHQINSKLYALESRLNTIESEHNDLREAHSKTKDRLDSIWSLALQIRAAVIALGLLILALKFGIWDVLKMVM